MARLFNGVLLILFGFLLGGVLLLITLPPRGEPVRLRPVPTAPGIVVHVGGNVAKPGVYELPAGARVRDAITAAGGVREAGADGEMNQAALLSDGEQVVVPGADARESAAPGSVEPARAPVNINTATQAELETLPGIGPATAQRIIAYREEHGAFEKVSDIVKVSGIGPSTYAKIQNLITTQP